MLLLRGPLLGVVIFASIWLFVSLFWAYGSFDHVKARIVTSESLRLTNLFDVKNETLGFQRIFVASLPERTDKRDSMSIAASLTGIHIEFVDGVDGSKIPQKAIPDSWVKDESNTTLGCWRAHMNIAQKMLRENIATALILEDDADWDVNIKAQLVEFARGTRYILEQETKSPVSPYGDGWDVLWVGHCGAKNMEDKDQRYWVVHNDPTAIPQTLWQYARRQPNLTPPALNGTFTRVVYAPTRGLCTWGYALSLEGARRWLRDQSEVQAKVSDRALNRLCSYVGGTCLAPYPPLVGTHRPAGAANKSSDRVDFGNRIVTKAETGQIVFSTRINFWPLIEKKGEIWSQWPKHTMLKTIPAVGGVEIPRGHGVVVNADEYKPYERPNQKRNEGSKRDGI